MKISLQVSLKDSNVEHLFENEIQDLIQFTSGVTSALASGTKTGWVMLTGNDDTFLFAANSIAYVRIKVIEG